jgi:hypothetical protein
MKPVTDREKLPCLKRRRTTLSIFNRLYCLTGGFGSSSTFEGWPGMLYMIVEHFKNKDAVAVYRRFRDRGRLAPEGLTYVSSWVDEKMERCFQIMETEDRTLLEQWMGNWSDIVEFEVYPVITSKEAVEKISPWL